MVKHLASAITRTLSNPTVIQKYFILINSDIAVLLQWAPLGAGESSGDDERGQHWRMGASGWRRTEPCGRQEAEDPAPRRRLALQTRVSDLWQENQRPEGGDELHHQERLPVQPSHAHLPPLENWQHEVWSDIPDCS